MKRKTIKLIKRVASSLAAGLTGTAVIQGIQMAGQKTMPEVMPPIKQHPGEFMVEKSEAMLPAETRQKIPRSVEKATAQALGLGYGLSFGLLYGLVHKKETNLVAEGTALGLATWAAGYLGWLPASGLMPPINRQRPVQVAGGIVSHIVFGLTTAGALRLMRQRGLAGV